jgi:hypothetical protein
MPPTVAVITYTPSDALPTERPHPMSTSVLVPQATGTASVPSTIVGPNSFASVVVTATGAVLGQPAVCGYSAAIPSAVSLDAVVSAADTIVCTFRNANTGPVTVPTGTLTAYAVALGSV